MAKLVEPSRFTVPFPIGHRPRRMAIGWKTTPTQYRALQAVLLCVCLAGGSVSVLSAQARVEATKEVKERAGPLSVDAIDVYRSLAAADAFVATEFLPGSDQDAARTAYKEAIATAASRLAHAGNLVDEQSLTAARLASITSQLPVYSELVGQARALDGVARRTALSDASTLMQSTILRRAEALQRGESRHLDDEYRRARTFSGAALASCVLGLAALGGAQVLVYRKTRRFINVGLAASFTLLVGALLWTTLASSISADHLDSAERHSGSLTDALGVARIAAFQARSNEMLALVVEDGGTTYDTNFWAKAQLLHHSDRKGHGGALGAAHQLGTIESRRIHVNPAIEASQRWFDAHIEVEELRKRGQIPQAIASTVDGTTAGAGAAFADLDRILAAAVADEDTAFRRDIRRAGEALNGLVVGIGLLVVCAGAAAIWGIGQRLDEYR